VIKTLLLIHRDLVEVFIWHNVEWWHRREQAPIQQTTLTPVATHALFYVALIQSDHAATKSNRQALIHACTLPPLVGIRCESRFNDDPELPPLNPESGAEVNA
jgi:hypothetical protein